MTSDLELASGPSSSMLIFGVAIIGICGVGIILFFLLRRKSGTETESLTHSGNKLANPEIKVLLTLSSDAVAITNRSLHVINYNSHFRELLGANIIMDEQDLASLLKVVDKTGQLVELHKLPDFKNQDTLDFEEFYILDQTNQKFEIHLQLSRLNSKLSNQIIYVWRLINVSERQRIEHEQSEFISVISHELRTPVAVVEASTSAILGDESEDLSPRQQKLVEAARENALLLSKLLTDLSAYGKLQKGDVALSTSVVSPHMVLEQIRRAFTSQAEAKHIALIVDHDEDAHSLKTSEPPILSILKNFVSNAIEYTEAGGVIIIGTKAVNDGIVFLVRDTGTGIDPTIKPHLFESKFHANTDTEHTTLKGPGLGLYISAQLAHALGARVWAESEEGQGSTFYLKVPMKAGGDKPEVEAEKVI